MSFDRVRSLWYADRMANSAHLLTPAFGGLFAPLAARIIGGISNLLGLLIQPRRG
jgi:hypothetical protein